MAASGSALRNEVYGRRRGAFAEAECEFRPLANMNNPRQGVPAAQLEIVVEQQLQ